MEILQPGDERLAATEENDELEPATAEVVREIGKEEVGVFLDDYM